MDNKKQVGSPDRDRININEDYEVTYWSKEFGVKPEELKAAVKSAGTAVKDVRKQLNK